MAIHTWCSWIYIYIYIICICNLYGKYICRIVETAKFHILKHCQNTTLYRILYVLFFSVARTDIFPVRDAFVYKWRRTLLIYYGLPFTPFQTCTVITRSNVTLYHIKAIVEEIVCDEAGLNNRYVPGVIQPSQCFTGPLWPGTVVSWIYFLHE